MKIFKTDISEKTEFNRIGYRYVRVWGDDENKVYVYQIISRAPYQQFEVVKGKKIKNSDGNIVYVSPWDEQLGPDGWYICGTAKNCNLKISQKLSELMGHSVKFECEAIG